MLFAYHSRQIDLSPLFHTDYLFMIPVRKSARHICETAKAHLSARNQKFCCSLYKISYFLYPDKQASGFLMTKLIYFQLTESPHLSLARCIFIELNDAWAQFEEEGMKSLY